MRKVDVETWAKEHLPKDLKDAWDDAARLSGLVHAAIEARVVEPIKGAVERLQELEPDSERAQTAAASVELAQDNKSKARELFEAVLAKFPESATALANLSRLHEMDGQTKDALEKARAALNLAPNNESLFQWWFALNWKQNRDELQPSLEEMANKPGHWRARMGLAELMLTLNEPGRALELYTEARTAAEDAIAVLAALAKSMADRGLVREIVSVLGDAWEQAISDPPTAALIAKSWLGRNDPDKAEAAIANLPDGEEASGLKAAIEARRSGASTPETIQVVPFGGPAWSVGLGVPPWAQGQRSLQGDESTIVGMLAWSVAEDAFPDARQVNIGSRGIPLALTEALWARSDVAPWTLLPIVKGQGVVRWTHALDLETIAMCSRALPEQATVVAGDITKGDDGNLLGTLWVLTPSKDEANKLEVTAPDLTALSQAAEEALLAELADKGRGKIGDAPEGLHPPARSPAYLAILDTLATQLLVNQGLLSPEAVLNEAFAPQQYAAVIEDNPGIASPALLMGAGVVACTRHRANLVPSFASKLEGVALPGWAKPLEVIINAALGDKTKPALSNPADKAWAEKLRPLF